MRPLTSIRVKQRRMIECAEGAHVNLIRRDLSSDELIARGAPEIEVRPDAW